jgi:hypothetical protein
VVSTISSSSRCICRPLSVLRTRLRPFSHRLGLAIDSRHFVSAQRFSIVQLAEPYTADGIHLLWPARSFIERIVLSAVGFLFEDVLTRSGFDRFVAAGHLAFVPDS